MALFPDFQTKRRNRERRKITWIRGVNSEYSEICIHRLNRILTQNIGTEDTTGDKNRWKPEVDIMMEKKQKEVEKMKK